MSRTALPVVKLSLVLALFLSIPAQADVKLRIYLQDGTLQAGNLISETEKSFVILTKEGRTEVSKEKIMFVNGKSLKQWEERPDRLFQTEIMPAEVPNPSYVNDKAALPEVAPVPELKSVMPPAPPAPVKEPAPAPKSASKEPVKEPAPSAKSAASSAPASAKTVPVAPSAAPISAASSSSPSSKSASAAAAKPTASQEPVTAAPVVKEEKQAAAVPAAVVPVEPKARKPKRAKKPAVEEPAVQEEQPAPVKAAAVPKPAPFRNGKFDRKKLAEFHRDRAEVFIHDGMKARAVQELHFANVLDRQNEQVPLILGKHYMDQGLYVRAEKLLAHPVLKKRDDVKQMVQQMKTNGEKEKKSRYILYGATAAGLLAGLPLMMFTRRFTRKPKKAPVMETESVETAADEPTSAEEQQPTAAFSDILQRVQAIQQNREAAKPVEPEPVAPPAFVPPFLDKATKEPPKPAFKPVEPARVEPPAPETKPFKGPLPASNPPAFIKPAAPPPPEVPIVVLRETPVTPPVEPVLTPVAAEPQRPPTPEEILKLGRWVDDILQKANGFAAEGKFDQARREYRTALALNPLAAAAYVGLGYISFSQGQWELAMQHYRKALEINPNSPDAHYGVGRVLLETDRAEESVWEFQATLQLDPTFDEALQTLTALGKAA